MSLYDRLPALRRLTVKVVGLMTVHLLLALVIVGATLLLSWQLEGGAAAINDAGSLRMRTFKLTHLLGRHLHEPDQRTLLRPLIEDEIVQFERTMASLRRGDPARPLFLPRDEEILATFARMERDWQELLRPMMQATLNPAGRGATLDQLQQQATTFVDLVNHEVALIEHNNASKTLWLRSSQMALIAMALIGTVTLVYLLFLMVVRPVVRLQQGIRRMAEGDFAVRLEVESQDEFGQLTLGFNQMADKLESLYSTLENRVRQKTFTLEQKNRELSCLYEITAFLSQPHNVEEMCGGFLARLMWVFGADGGAVRVTDPRRENLHLVVHQGLPEELVRREYCMNVNQCLCGESARQGVAVVHDLRRVQPGERILPCEQDGFNTVSVFQIRAASRSLGVFNLHFRESHQFTEQEMRLLQTLGDHLGIAIENIRLAAKEREMAVSQERNLMAQGLHDSIAQGLTFLNLQAQLLENSLARGDLAQAHDTMPLIRAGITESYEDVRELLLNFRSRLEQEDLPGAIETTLNKFSRQTGIRYQFHQAGDGPPLPPEQQLQVLFILQEALSNIRKHADATRVEVSLQNSGDLELLIRDNGVGFDPELVKSKADQHVGLSIMRERAKRVGAHLDIVPTEGDGVTVRLWLPRGQRMAA